jgi:hypothetical protein
MTRRHIRRSGWLRASAVTSVLLLGGCNWFAASKPTTVEKEDPAPTTVVGPESNRGNVTATAAPARHGAAGGSKNRTPSQRHPATASPTTAADGAAAVDAPATTEVPEPLTSRSAVSSPADAPVVVGSRAIVADERSLIYSKADADVTPPRLLTVQNGGPTFRNMKMDINTMELLISKQGRVEQVKLMTPVKRMTDMLLLSGAKTWTFSPALRNGQPVRYRTQYSWQTTP